MSEISGVRLWLLLLVVSCTPLAPIAAQKPASKPTPKAVAPVTPQAARPAVPLHSGASRRSARPGLIRRAARLSVRLCGRHHRGGRWGRRRDDVNVAPHTGQGLNRRRALAWMTSFLLIRAASFHHVYTFLRSLPHWGNVALELSGIGMVAAGAVQTLRSTRNDHQPSQ